MTLRQVFLIFSTFLLFACCKQPQAEFKFEKLVFHSYGKGCEGYCPTYHIQIDSSRNVLLYSETVWKTIQEIKEVHRNFKQSTTDKNGFIIDSVMSKLMDLEKDKSRMGYFKGQVTDSNYRKLYYLLLKANVDSLKFKNSTCCDGINKTLIIDYNKKTKVLESMFPPDSLNPLFNLLYDVVRQGNFTRTRDTFNLRQ